MRIHFYATLRPSADGKTLQLDLTPPVTVYQVLQRATELKPKLDAELWDEKRQLHDHIKVFVNGRELAYLPQGIQTILKETDELDVFPPVGGGAR